MMATEVNVNTVVAALWLDKKKTMATEVNVNTVVATIQKDRHLSTRKLESMFSIPKSTINVTSDSE